MAADRRTDFRPQARCPMSQHRWNHPPQDPSELITIDPLASGGSVPNGWKPANSQNLKPLFARSGPLAHNRSLR
jgi:hypothetical protein